MITPDSGSEAAPDSGAGLPGVVPPDAASGGGWALLRATVSRALALSASAQPLSGLVSTALPDTRDGVLATRWLQALCLLPGIAFEELGEKLASPSDVAAGEAQASALRRTLLPFLDSTLALSIEYGWPVIRSLSALEPQFPSLRAVEDVYLVGDSLLVAPVLTPDATTREFPLPHGAWVDWWTQRVVEGGRRLTVDAPLEQVPLFVRAGAVVPVLPEAAPPAARPRLRVYPGEQETVLYEGAGPGDDYRFVYLTCTRDGEFFRLARRVAGSFRPADDRLTVEVIGLEAEPTDVRVDRRGAPLWFYNRGRLEIPLTDDFTQLELVL